MVVEGAKRLGNKVFNQTTSTMEIIAFILDLLGKKGILVQKKQMFLILIMRQE